MIENEQFWRKKKISLIKCGVGTFLFAGIVIIMWLFPKQGVLWSDMPLGVFFLASLLNYTVHHIHKALNWPPPNDSE
jgi:hypothetical protein